MYPESSPTFASAERPEKGDPLADDTVVDVLHDLGRVLGPLGRHEGRPGFGRPQREVIAAQRQRLGAAGRLLQAHPMRAMMVTFVLVDSTTVPSVDVVVVVPGRQL